MVSAFERYKFMVKNEFKDPMVWRNYFVEFVISFWLMVVQGTCIQRWGDWTHYRGLDQISICMGSIVALLIGTFSGVTDIVLNPAMVFALMVGMKLSVPRGFIYIGVQCCGCIAGTAFGYAILPDHRRLNMASTQPHPDVNLWAAVCWEAWATSLLALVGNTNQDHKRKHKYFFGEILIFGVIDIVSATEAWPTGASVNPARSLGPAVMMNHWRHHWVYWVGPCAGAFIASAVYQMFIDRPDREKVIQRQQAVLEARDEKFQQLVESVLKEMTEDDRLSIPPIKTIYTEDMEKLVNELVKVPVKF